MPEVHSGRGPGVPLPESRELTDRERQLLAFLLSRPFPGREELKVQLEQAKAVPDCTCGCPTFKFELAAESPRAPIDGHLPLVEAWRYEPPELGCDVMLWVKEGFLEELELVSHAPDAVTEWPDPNDPRILHSLDPHWQP